MSNIAIGIYPIKHFLTTLGESVSAWNTQRNFLLNYWVNIKSYNLEIFNAGGAEYINLKAAIADYEPMPNPIEETLESESSWMRSKSFKELTESEITEWTEICDSKGINEDEILKSFYDSTIEKANKNFAEAKEEFYKQYGEYPVRMVKTYKAAAN